MSNRTPHNNAPGRLNPVRVPSSRGRFPCRSARCAPLIRQLWARRAVCECLAAVAARRERVAKPGAPPAGHDAAAAAAPSSLGAAAARWPQQLLLRMAMPPPQIKTSRSIGVARSRPASAGATRTTTTRPRRPSRPPPRRRRRCASPASGGSGFAPDEEDGDDDEQPSSPLKRQSRTPAFGQAHALAPDLKAARAKAEAAAAAAAAATPPQTTVVDVFSPGMLRVPVFRIPSLLTLPNGVCLAFAEARPHLHDSG